MLLLLGGEPVGAHQQRRLFRQHPHAVDRPAGKQHPHEPQVVIGGRPQPAAGVAEGGRLDVRGAHHVVAQLIFFVEPVHGRGAVPGFGRYEEPGVGHPRRAQDAFVENLVERLVLDAGRDDAQQIDGVAVGDSVAGLMHQGERGQFGQPGIRALIERQPQIGPRDRPGHRESVGQAAGVGQQILEQDGAARRMRAVQRTVWVVQHLDIGQLRRPARDRVLERELSLVDQAHHRGHRDRFGH